MSQASQSVDLTNCDREPIHIPGSIQPHGCLLACDVALSRIERASANAAAMLGHGGDLGGLRLAEVLDSALVHDLRNALATANVASRPALMMGATTGGRRFDVAVHQHKSTAIIEFEPAPESEQPHFVEFLPRRVVQPDVFPQRPARTLGTARSERKLEQLDHRKTPGRVAYSRPHDVRVAVLDLVVELRRGASHLQGREQTEPESAVRFLLELLGPRH